MPADPLPTVDDTLVKCGKCPREFGSYRWRKFTASEGEVRVLVDRDGLVIYDLVLVCSCGVVFHHHTKEETLKKHAELYRSALSAYERLMRYYVKTEAEGAIISDDNSKLDKPEFRPGSRNGTA